MRQVALHLLHDADPPAGIRDAPAAAQLPREEETARGLRKLTRRERQVLRLLAAGQDTAAIATRLAISPTTVRNHVHHILSKLGVRTRLEAVVMAQRDGLLRDD